MKAFLDWLDHRTGFRRLAHEALYESVPGGARWRYVWGSTLLFAFFVQVVTGLFLWMAYSPSTQTAWESVFTIQTRMQGGWLLRGLHHFMAQAMVVLLALHFMQVVIDRAYRAPREVNYWLGLVLMLLVLGLALTGYLLPWDQKGYWATRVATSLMNLANRHLPALVVGGPDYGQATLTRFFAFHAGVLPLLLGIVLIAHVWLFRRHGITAKQPLKAADATFWPDQALKDVIACLAVLAVVLFLIVRPALFGGSGMHTPPSNLGAELGAAADPTNAYSAARPEWYFLFLFQFLKLFGRGGEFFGAIVVPGLVVGFMFLMPFVGRWKLGHAFNVAYLATLLLCVCGLTAAAYVEDHRAEWITPDQFAAEYGEVQEVLRKCDNDPAKIEQYYHGDAAKLADFRRRRAALDRLLKSEDYLKAVAQAKADADRVKQLAVAPDGSPRILPEGALELLRHDPKTQGQRLFARHCASCHTYFDPDQPGPAPLDRADRLARATASNLYGFGSARWIGGLLDPKQISGPQYFGGTSHKAGDMAGFVGGDLQNRAKWSKDQIAAVVAALTAEADLPGQSAPSADRKKEIASGRILIADKDRCAQCHRFGDPSVDLGTAPDLTGYASRQWLTDFISNPGHERFYGDSNDRMPAFAAEPGASEKNLLTPQEIGYLVNWLRGDWDAAR